MHRERALQTKEQFDALEAADAEIAVERLVEGWSPRSGAAQFGQQPAEDLEHLPLDAFAADVPVTLHDTAF